MNTSAGMTPRMLTRCRLIPVRRLLTRRRIIGVLLALTAMAVAVRVEAQFRQRGLVNPRVAIEEDFDSSFQFCRIAFRNHPDGDGGDWQVDSPWAEVNLSI